MERIKRAIEHAKKTGPDAVGEFDESAQSGRKSKKSSSSNGGMSTLKWVASVIMIFLAAGAWLRLDCMNQKELQDSAQICNGIEQARAEAKRRASTEAKIEKLILANYNYCKASAEKSRNDYVKLVQNAVQVENEKIMSRKRDKATPARIEKFFIPVEAVRESKNMLNVAQTECMKLYDDQMKSYK